MSKDRNESLPLRECRAGTMEFPEALSTAGLRGRQQVMIVVGTFMMNVYCGWQSLSIVFTTIAVPFACNSSSDSVTTVSASNSTSALVRTTGDPAFNDDCVSTCSQYVFSDSPSSVVSSFDMACGDGPYLVSLANSVFWFAYFMSCLTSGMLSDRLGRRPLVLGSVALCFFALLASAFSPDIYVFIGLRFVCGYAQSAYSTITYVAMTETIDPVYLARIGMGIQIIYAIGEMLAAVSGIIFMQSWRLQIIVISSSLLPLFIYYFLFFPESPRWLFVTRRYDKCQKVLNGIAKFNGRAHQPIVLRPSGPTSEGNFPHEMVLDSRASDEIKKKSNVLDLYGTPKAALASITSVISWFSVSLVYYGLAFGVGGLAGNIYLNSILLACVEMPAYFACFVMDRIGRKKTFIGCVLLASIACLILPFTGGIANGAVQVGLSLVGKMMVTGAFDGLYIYAPEQYPTVLKGTALSMCSAGACIASIIAPFMSNAGDIVYFLPYVIFAGSGFLSAALCLLFAVETLHKPLPESVQDYYDLLGNGTGYTSISRDSHQT